MNRVKLYAMLVGVGLFVSLNAGGAVSGVTTAAHHADEDGVPSYAFTTLMVSGAVNTDAWDINSHGVIVGHYVAANVTYGFVATRHGGFMTIDAPGAVFTQATAINDRGDIAGTYRLPNDAVPHAYLLREDGSFTNIDVPNAASSLPRDIDMEDNVTFEAIVAGHSTAYLLTHGAYLNIEPPASFAGDIVTFSYRERHQQAWSNRRQVRHRCSRRARVSARARRPIAERRRLYNASLPECDIVRRLGD